MTDQFTWRDLEARGHVSSFNFVNTYEQDIPSMEQLKGLTNQLLRAYGLDPNSIEVETPDKTWKVRKGNQAFVLKKTTMGELERVLFFNRLAQNGPIRTPVLSLTNSGLPFYQEEQAAYYLVPWISSSTNQRENESERLWDTLGEWHRLTSVPYELNSNWIESFSTRCLEVWSEQVLTMDQFMNDCEHRVYPSPFEQRFMVFYSELRQGAEEAYRRMKNWEEIIAEQTESRTVLCHGKPSGAHLISSGRQDNWISTEAAGVDLPVRDLTWLLRWGLSDLYRNPDSLLQGINQYETVFPLEKHEKKLLSAHLCHPATVVSVLHKYREGKRQFSERDYTVNLERTYHRWGKTWQALSAYLDGMNMAQQSTEI